MNATTQLKLNDLTKNFMRRLIVDNYLSNEESIESLIYLGYEGVFNLSDEKLITEELPKIGFDSVEEFERYYSKEIGLV